MMESSQGSGEVTGNIITEIALEQVMYMSP
jgi:hypothetical protein